MQSRLLILLALALATPAGVSSAQSRWVLTPEIGLASFSGASKGTSGGIEVGGHPSGMTSAGVRLEKETGGTHLALGLLFGKPGFQAGTTEGLTVTLNDQFTMIELRPELTLPLARVGGEGTLRAAVGPLAMVSRITQGPTHLLFGGLAALSLVIPLSPRVATDVRYEVALTQSPLRADDLPPELSSKPMWRRRLALGVRLGL